MREESLFVVVVVLFCCVGLSHSENGVQRFGHTTVTLSNGTVVIFGGYDYEKIDRPQQQFIGLKNDLWMIDVLSPTPQWVPITVLPSMNENGTLEMRLPAARMHHSAYIATVDGDEIMSVFGGTVFLRYSRLRTTVFKACGREDIWEFNFNLRTWKEIRAHTSTCSGAVGGSWDGYFGIVGSIVLVMVCMCYMGW